MELLGLLADEFASGNFARTFVDMLGFLAAETDWHVFIYAYAMAAFMYVRGFGLLAAIGTFAVTCMFVFLLGWHGLALIVAIILGSELKLWEIRHAGDRELRRRMLDALEAKRAAAGPSEEKK